MFDFRSRSSAASSTFKIRVLVTTLTAVCASLLIPGLITARQQGLPPTPQQPPLNAGPPSRPGEPTTDMPSPLTPKQQREILKSGYQKMKEDADELASMAKALQEDLNKSNHNILSLRVLERADKIEKLAKKIKNEAVR